LSFPRTTSGESPQILPQVLAQDPRLEVLVVDDASPDGTGQIADEMAARQSRLHVLHRQEKILEVGGIVLEIGIHLEKRNRSLRSKRPLVPGDVGRTQPHFPLAM